MRHPRLLVGVAVAAEDVEGAEAELEEGAAEGAVPFLEQLPRLRISTEMTMLRFLISNR
jgi:hypothetical protein